MILFEAAPRYHLTGLEKPPFPENPPRSSEMSPTCITPRSPQMAPTCFLGGTETESNLTRNPPTARHCSTTPNQACQIERRGQAANHIARLNNNEKEQRATQQRKDDLTNSSNRIPHNNATAIQIARTTVGNARANPTTRINGPKAWRTRP